MKAALLTTVLILLSVPLMSTDGHGHIHSVRILPPDPTAEDSIYIEVRCWFPDSCWHIEGSTWEQSENSIRITARASDSWTTGPNCSDIGIDSLLVSGIGYLDEGLYALQVVESLESKRDTVPDTVVQEFGVGPQTAADEENPDLVPGSFTLGQNYPNPFNATTSIPYTVRKACHVIMVICNPLGREVRTIIDRHARPGDYVATWDGTDDFGNDVPSGVYFYRVVTKDGIPSRKMLLLR